MLIGGFGGNAGRCSEAPGVGAAARRYYATGTPPGPAAGGSDGKGIAPAVPAEGGGSRAVGESLRDSHYAGSNFLGLETALNFPILLLRVAASAHAHRLAV